MAIDWRPCPEYAGEFVPMGSEDHNRPTRRRCKHPALGRLVTVAICGRCPEPKLLAVLRAADVLLHYIQTQEWWRQQEQIPKLRCLIDATFDALRERNDHEG